jgi:hypothetical protein
LWREALVLIQPSTVDRWHRRWHRKVYVAAGAAARDVPEDHASIHFIVI